MGGCIFIKRKQFRCDVVKSKQQMAQAAAQRRAASALKRPLAEVPLSEDHSEDGSVQIAQQVIMEPAKMPEVGFIFITITKSYCS